MTDRLTYVIAEPCIGCKDGACIEVCPVDCIHDAGTQMVIDPNECIYCGRCETECPVDAIFPVDEVPEKWTSFIAVNADFYRRKR